MPDRPALIAPADLARLYDGVRTVEHLDRNQHYTGHDPGLRNRAAVASHYTQPQTFLVKVTSGPLFPDAALYPAQLQQVTGVVDGALVLTPVAGSSCYVQGVNGGELELNSLHVCGQPVRVHEGKPVFLTGGGGGDGGGGGEFALQTVNSDASDDEPETEAIVADVGTGVRFDTDVPDDGETTLQLIPTAYTQMGAVNLAAQVMGDGVKLFPAGIQVSPLQVIAGGWNGGDAYRDRISYSFLAEVGVYGESNWFFGVSENETLDPTGGQVTTYGYRGSTGGRRGYSCGIIPPMTQAPAAQFGTYVPHTFTVFDDAGHPPTTTYSMAGFAVFEGGPSGARYYGGSTPNHNGARYRGGLYIGPASPPVSPPVISPPVVTSPPTLLASPPALYASPPPAPKPLGERLTQVTSVEELWGLIGNPILWAADGLSRWRIRTDGAGDLETVEVFDDLEVGGD